MWWETEKFTDREPIPPEFDKYAGPSGIAAVRAWPDGKTDPGWGMAPGKNGAFMENYTIGRFDARVAEMGWRSGRWDFAFVMRSLDLICIDIDGKNGGLENAGKLGQLPRTLAETSKSGNGYHLFYSTGDTWDEKLGFAKFKDRVGLYDGIDIRAVGCVYHYPNQAWNGKYIAKLPDFLEQKLLEHANAATMGSYEIQQIVDETDDPDVVLVIQSNLLDELAKPIPAGRRNNSLFAIGSKMYAAKVVNWQTKLINRAQAVGLDNREASKIVANILKYGVQP